MYIMLSLLVLTSRYIFLFYFIHYCLLLLIFFLIYCFWFLKTILSSCSRDYIDFLEDLEEDQQLRHNVNIYRDANKLQNTDTESEAGEVPRIGLEEMLDDLQIDMEAAGGNDDDEEDEMDE